MTSRHSGIKLFLISIVLSALVPTGSPAEEDGSLFEIIQSALQEAVQNQNGNAGILGGIFQDVMQGEGGKQLGDMLTKSKGSSADLIANLASIWQASKFNFATTDESGAKKDLSFDPSVLGSMVDLISSFSKASTDTENNNIDENNNDGTQLPKPQESSLDWGSLLSFAASMMSGQQGGSAGGLESFLSFLPVIMNSLTGQHNAHSSRLIPHHTHAPFLPPFLENIHEYWDHFLNSEFGKTLWHNSGLSELVKGFSNKNGEIEADKVFESLENNTFRRRWIKSISSFIAQWTKHFTNPEIQRSYLETAKMVSNGFLRAQGYPEETMIDLNQPAKSTSALINAVFDRQFKLNVNSEVYIEPAFAYIQELFKMGKKKGFGVLQLTEKDIESRLSETMDSEVIEPILRVNRAYKFAIKRPECAKYVICAINQNTDVTKSGLKPGITKLSSLGASWFIASQGSTDFWELYEAAVDGKGCTKADDKCSEFDTQDIQATTRYYHNEL